MLLLAVTCVTSIYAKDKKDTTTVLSQTKQVLSDVGSKAGELYDSTKAGLKNGAVAVGNGIHYVDTNSTFKEFYHDTRNGVIALAEALKVGVEFVFAKLVLQQIVKSCVNLSVVIILVFVPLIWFKRMRLWAASKQNGENGVWIAWILATILPMLAGIIFFFCTATTTLTGFINPAYGAMRDVVDMAQQIRNNPTQCQSCR